MNNQNRIPVAVNSVERCPVSTPREKSWKEAAGPSHHLAHSCSFVSKPVELDQPAILGPEQANHISQTLARSVETQPSHRTGNRTRRARTSECVMSRQPKRFQHKAASIIITCPRPRRPRRRVTASTLSLLDTSGLLTIHVHPSSAPSIDRMSPDADPYVERAMIM